MTRELLLMAVLLVGASSCRHQRFSTEENPFQRQSGDSSASPDETRVVDVGNPKDVGPGKTGKTTLYLADAPLGDELARLLLRPVAVQFIREKRKLGEAPRAESIVSFDLKDFGEHDLLAYRNGQKLALLRDAVLPAGEYHEVRVILDSEAAAVVETMNGREQLRLPSPEEAEGGKATNVTALHGMLNFQVTEDRAADLTLHVDVRKSLRRAGEVPQELAKGANASDKWLLPTQHLFYSDSAGGLKGLGLDLLVKVVCAYERGTAKDTSSACFGAAASSLIQGGIFYLPYLKPGVYELRFFLDDSTSLDHVIGSTIEATKIMQIDLSALNLPSLP